MTAEMTLAPGRDPASGKFAKGNTVTRTGSVNRITRFAAPV